MFYLRAADIGLSPPLYMTGWAQTGQNESDQIIIFRLATLTSWNTIADVEKIQMNDVIRLPPVDRLSIW